MATGQRVEASGATASVIEFTFLVGLSCVFLVNTFVAFIEPDAFTTLIKDSLLDNVVPFATETWVATVIGMNDLLLGGALLVTIRAQRWRAPVLAWVGVWLAAVSFVKLTALAA